MFCGDSAGHHPCIFKETRVLTWLASCGEDVCVSKFRLRIITGAYSRCKIRLCRRNDEESVCAPLMRKTGKQSRVALFHNDNRCIVTCGKQAHFHQMEPWSEVNTVRLVVLSQLNLSGSFSAFGPFLLHALVNESIEVPGRFTLVMRRTHGSFGDCLLKMKEAHIVSGPLDGVTGELITSGSFVAASLVSQVQHNTGLQPQPAVSRGLKLGSSCWSLPAARLARWISNIRADITVDISRQPKDFCVTLSPYVGPSLNLKNKTKTKHRKN